MIIVFSWNFYLEETVIVDVLQQSLFSSKKPSNRVLQIKAIDWILVINPMNDTLTNTDNIQYISDLLCRFYLNKGENLLIQVDTTV